MIDLWTIILFEHNRQNSATLLQNIMGNFKSIIGPSLVVE